MQQQNLSQLMGGAKAKLESSDNVKAKAETKPEPTFFEKMIPGLRSGDIQHSYDLAKQVGETRAKAFIDSLRVPSHPKHSENVHSFYRDFGGDYSNVVNAYVSCAQDELNAPNPEDCKQDVAYEDRIAKQYKPNGGMTHEDLAFYDILMDSLKKSRDARGYGKGKCYDNAVIADWKAKYRR